MSAISKTKRSLLTLLLAVGLLSFCGVLQASAKSGAASAKTVSGAGWTTGEAGRMYQYEDGTYAQNAWLNIGGSIYYFDQNGVSVCGKWLKQGNRYYYFQKKGKLATDKIICTGKKYYYVNKSGVRVKSQWVQKKRKNTILGRMERVSRISGSNTRTNTITWDPTARWRSASGSETTMWERTAPG